MKWSRSFVLRPFLAVRTSLLLHRSRKEKGKEERKKRKIYK
jgi:hypothetical protein